MQGRPGWRTRVRRALFAGIVAALFSSSVVLTTSSGTAQASTAARGIGVVSDLTWYMSRPDMDRSIAAMRDAGVQWVRANMTWSTVEPNANGVLDAWWMPELDYAITKAQAAGLKVLMPISDGVPYWASADPAKYVDATGGRHWNKYWKPTNIQDYADFARTIAARYSPMGVHAYEVWNEPNYVRFWPSGPNPVEYAAMLRATYPAIKQADPNATVVMGGLSGNDYTFLQGVYSAGGGAFFDRAAVHPYTNGKDPTLCWYEPGTTRNAKFALCGIEEVRKTMLANGDSRDLWLTEMGWSTSSVTNSVSEAAQADYLTKAFTKIESYPYVANTFWYSFRNNWWTNNDPSDLEANYGLLRVDFSPKPALSAFKAYATTAAPPTTTPTTVPVTTTTTAPAIVTTTSTVPDVETTTTTTVPDVVTTTAPASARPTLTSVRTSALTPTTANVLWTTDIASDSMVVYWPAGSTSTLKVTDPWLVTAHQIGLSSLQPATTYLYLVVSVSSGMASVSGTYSFTTAR
ncbi:MAG: cellulase family glycosylhydrolase [Acidimicrobiales bacterium]